MADQPNMPASQDDSGFNVFIDERYGSYGRFFDHKWAGGVLNEAKRTKLDALVLQLCAEWKGVASTASMPWLLVDTLRNFHRGYMLTDEPFWSRLAAAFGKYLTEKSGLSHMKKKQMMRVIYDLGQQVQEEMKQRPAELAVEDVWRRYLAIPEFRMALWSSQRICYGAIYYAYENLLRGCAAIGKPNTLGGYRSIRDIKSDLNEVLGVGVGDSCVDDPKVFVARLARNAIVHAGGRASPELIDQHPEFVIKDGIIHIMASDVRQLFALLKEKTQLLVGKVLLLPDYGPGK